MKRQIAAVGLIVIFLVVLIPFASSNPDGLEKVVATYGAQEHANLWSGLMTDYSIGAVGDSYASTALASVFGVFMVLAAAFLVGKSLAKKSESTVRQ
ncbi:MAG: PDGLE domain-containing protein [Candidatus Bathyarchaeota archaeon]|nr:PDGLE domain-containing protein [Candidatus Bathyarchaeota archaeon]